MKRTLALLICLTLLMSVFVIGSVSAEDTRPKIKVTIYNRGNVPASQGTIEDNRWTRWINENAPVQVEFVPIPRSGPENVLYPLFADPENAPDLVFEYSPSIRSTLYQQGSLMPLTEAIEKYSTVYKARLEKFPSLKQAALMDDGEMYALGKVNASNFTRCVLIRKDWLDKLNLEVPVTVDDWYKVAEAFCEQDPDGNGEKDTYAIALGFRATETFNQMFYGEEIMPGDGEMRYGWDDIARRLTFQKWLYDNNYIDRDFLTDTNGVVSTQSFLNGKTGILPMLNSLTRNWCLTDYATFKANNPDGELLPILYPELDGVTYMPTLQNPIQNVCFVNAATKNLEAVMAYVDFVCSREYNMMLTYGIEGEDYEIVDGIPTSKDASKYAEEFSWNGDFMMLKNSDIFPEYVSDTDTFDLTNPLEAECYELRKKALALYLNPELKYPGLTHSEHMPQLPEDLAVIRASINLGEYYNRAVVSGADYTVEQAIADAKNAWESAGGQMIMDWYQDWYENDSENAFLAEAMIKMVCDNNPLNYLK